MVGPVPSANFQAVIQAFEKQFPGVKVQYQVVKNNVQLANLRVQMAAHKVQYDVAEGGDSELGTLIPQHMVTQVNWQQYGVPSKLIYHGLVEYNNLPTLFIYNVSKVPKNEVPHSWNDLLNPRWAGKIALDARGTFMTPFLLDPKMGGASAGVAWAKKALALKPLFEPSLSAIQPMVESGQVDIGGDAVDSALPPLLAPKGPLGIVPVSPIQVANFYAYVPQGAPHPSGGELMVAWMASPQGQSVLNVNYNGLVTSCSNPGPSLLTQLLCNNGITSWTSLQNLQQNEAAIKYYKTIQQTFGTYVGK